MNKINETEYLGDTDPSLYTGFAVDPVTGKAVKKGEDDEMNDLELHTKDGIPDDPKHPAINVQAEAISLYMINTEGKEVAEDALATWPLLETPQTTQYFRVMQREASTRHGVHLVYENTTTGQRGFVTPALFVKIYSKALVAEQVKEARAQSGSEQKPMSESKPNMALAHELLALGLVNNVKETTQVLREENPMRKAMEIFYASKNSNADKDEVKYVPSVIKEGKAVLPKNADPVGLPKSEPTTGTVVEQKKKRIIYW